MNTPARLHKKQTWNEKIDDWALDHQVLIISFCFIGGGILIICLAYTIVGVAAVESGMMRNFLIRGV